MSNINVKVVVLGAQGVGKTSLVTRYCSGVFPVRTTATVGAAYSNVTVQAHGSTVNMQIWDTAGQERYRALGPLYYRNVGAAVLVYDITDSQSFTETQSWTRDLLQHVLAPSQLVPPSLAAPSPPPLVLVLLGNKADREEDRDLQRSDALAFADHVGAVHFETSALTSDGVSAAFEHIALVLGKRALEERKLGAGPRAARSVLDLRVDAQQRSNCC